MTFLIELAVEGVERGLGCVAEVLRRRVRDRLCERIFRSRKIAGRGVKLSRLTVHTPTPGFVAVVRAGSSQVGPFTDDSTAEQVGATTTFRLRGADARYYVVWITRLPAGGKAEISEVTAG